MEMIDHNVIRACSSNPPIIIRCTEESLKSSEQLKSRNFYNYCRCYSDNLSRLCLQRQNPTEKELRMETMPLNEGVTTTSYQSAENESAFICNICLEITNKDPVVTQCGHLYCWPCLYRWLNTQQTPCCPVCKAGRARLTF
jgi:Ring finger domain